MTEFNTKLRRTLRFHDLVLYGMVYMAPVAGFTVYGFVMEASAGAIVLAYLIGGAAVLTTALSYGVMARAVPSAGSVYSYARAGLGRFAGFMGGWAILLDYILIPALLILIGSSVMNAAIPAIPTLAWAAVFIAISTTVNISGIKFTAQADFVLAAAQIALVAVFVLGALYAIFFRDGQSLSLIPVVPESGLVIGAAISGASIAILSFLGFDAISTLAEEVDDGEKASGSMVAKAMVGCIVLMTFLFVVISWLLADLGRGLEIADASQAAFIIIDAKLPWLSFPVALVAGLATGIGASIPPQAAVSRILFAMSRDGQLPRPLATLHGKFATPYVAVLLVAAVMALVCYLAVEHIDFLLSVVNLGALVAFLMVNVSVIAFTRKNRSESSIVRHLILPLLGSAIVAYLIFSLPGHTLLIGAAWLAIGMLYYAYLRYALGRSGELEV